MIHKLIVHQSKDVFLPSLLLRAQVSSQRQKEALC